MLFEFLKIPKMLLYLTKLKLTTQTFNVVKVVNVK